MLCGNNKYRINVIVAWAVSTKNALHTCYGYSPNQLVFGTNPNFPPNLTNKPPVFLQVKGINRDVYVRPPKEAETTKLRKLQTTVYGLYDAPRVWCLKVKGDFKTSGAV